MDTREADWGDGIHRVARATAEDWDRNSGRFRV